MTKWFPPGDALATKVARLCILREDFLLEMNGVFTEKIDELDGNSEEWRRLYFIRNLIRTLREIESGIQRLLSDPDFRVLLARQTGERRKEFDDHARVMGTNVALLNEVRNEICGHVLETAVQEALNEMSSEAFGFLEISSTMEHTYFKFAGKLVVQILVRGAPEVDKHHIFSEKIEKIAKLFSGFALIERILAMYMWDRGLMYGS
jgi:hypothetical protein